MLSSLVNIPQNEGFVLGLGFLLVLTVSQIFVGSAALRRRWLTIGSGLLTVGSMLSGSLLLVMGAFVISLFPLAYGSGVKRLSSMLVYFGTCLGTFTGAGILLYQDLGGFELSAGAHIRSETVALFCLASLLRGGVVPFHGFLLQGLRSAGYSTLINLFNPIGLFLPVLLINAVGSFPEENLCLRSLLIFGFGISWYFALASFSEKSFERFLYYVFSSISCLTLVMVPLLGVEASIAAVYFYTSTIIASAGLLLCLSFLRQRYGCQRVVGHMGMFQASPGLGCLFIYFLFCLANMPLTLSFLGEDVMLNLIFHLSVGAGFCALAALTLNGISLFRFYTLVFGGTWPSYPILPLLLRERLALILLFGVGLVMPIMSLF